MILNKTVYARVLYMVAKETVEICPSNLPVR